MKIYEKPYLYYLIYKAEESVCLLKRTNLRKYKFDLKIYFSVR